MSKEIMVEGLFPAEIEKTDIGYDARVWNRTYKMGNSPLFDSIISGGEELLAGPIRVVGLDGERPLVWNFRDETVDMGDTTIRKMVDDDESTEKRFIRATQSERFVLNTQYSVDYDGCAKCMLSVMPRGRSVAQGFGLGAKVDNSPRTLDRFWLEVPLKKSVAKFYQYLPTFHPEYHHVDPIENENISLGFVSNIFVGNEDVGLSLFFDSDKNWQVEDKDKYVEIIVNEDDVVLRFHLIDRDPDCWLNKGGNGMGLLPIVFEFGVQATPVKPFPKNPFKEHNLHIDCYKKVFIDYESFLFEKKSEDGEIMIDRIARLGVDTLYLHEKWNDLQHSVDLTEETANRLVHIIDEAHKRGIKVIPYFGYELSSLSPMYHPDYAKYRKIRNERCMNQEDSWYRYPWQRATYVCNSSEYGEYFLNGIDKLMTKYGFDGIYLDGTLLSPPCINEAHGCGYRDREGNLRPTYNVWKIRDFSEKLYEIVHRHGGIINFHASECMQTYNMAFVDSIWDGEVIQGPLLHGKVDEVPEVLFRCAYTGRNIGVPVQMLCYSNPPQWTFHQATANVLPFGILPKPVDVGEPLEEMDRIHKIYDAFPIEKAEWMPFYKNSVECEKDIIRTSYFECGNKVLAIIANMKNVPSGDVRIKFPFVIKSIVNAMTGESIEMQDSTIIVSFEKFDYLLLNIEK